MSFLSKNAFPDLGLDIASGPNLWWKDDEAQKLGFKRFPDAAFPTDRAIDIFCRLVSGNSAAAAKPYYSAAYLQLAFICFRDPADMTSASMNTPIFGQYAHAAAHTGFKIHDIDLNAEQPDQAIVAAFGHGVGDLKKELTDAAVGHEVYVRAYIGFWSMYTLKMIRKTDLLGEYIVDNTRLTRTMQSFNTLYGADVQLNIPSFNQAIMQQVGQAYKSNNTSVMHLLYMACMRKHHHPNTASVLDAALLRVLEYHAMPAFTGVAEMCRLLKTKPADLLRVLSSSMMEHAIDNVYTVIAVYTTTSEKYDEVKAAVPDLPDRIQSAVWKVSRLFGGGYLSCVGRVNNGEMINIAAAVKEVISGEQVISHPQFVMPGTHFDRAWYLKLARDLKAKYSAMGKPDAHASEFMAKQLNIKPVGAAGHGAENDDNEDEYDEL